MVSLDRGSFNRSELNTLTSINWFNLLLDASETDAEPSTTKACADPSKHANPNTTAMATFPTKTQSEQTVKPKSLMAAAG